MKWLRHSTNRVGSSPILANLQSMFVVSKMSLIAGPLRLVK